MTRRFHGCDESIAVTWEADVDLHNTSYGAKTYVDFQLLWVFVCLVSI